MICDSCGHDAAAEHRYCDRCGQPLPANEASHAETVDGLPNVPWRDGHVALGIVLVLLSFALVFFLSEGLALLAGRHSQAVATWQRSHLMGFAILAIVWALGLRPTNAPLSMVGINVPKIPPFRCTALTVGALGASIGMNVAYVALIQFSGWQILQPPEIPMEVLFPGAWIILTFQALALWTPFTEEVFFRGFIFPGLAHRLGSGWAIVASAVVFSLFHIDPRVMGPIFVTGLLLAWLYHQTGSLWPSVAAHAGQNAIAIATSSYGGWTIPPM